MGQYHLVVNLDKKEFIDPHRLGCGLKLWEQLASHPGTGAALIPLLACPIRRGGGDLDVEQNWHGPERKFPEHNLTPGPMPEDYEVIAKMVIGRWAGDRLAIVGDYADDEDLDAEHKASTIYKRCRDPVPDEVLEGPLFKDISTYVARVIEHELGGKYTGKGWAQWKEDDSN